MIASKYNPYKENGVILGMAQTGKTRYAKIINKAFVETGKNQIIYDPNWRWTNTNHKDEPLFSPECVIHTVHDIKPAGLCIIQPHDDSEEFFTSVCEKVWSYRYIGNFNFTVDELHNNVTTFKAANAFKRIVRNCNNFNIAYLAIMQRTQEVPKMVISNSRHRWCFRLDWPDDVKLMKKFLGQAVDKLSPDSDNPLPYGHGFYQKSGCKVEEFES